MNEVSAPAEVRAEVRAVVGASAVGTIMEWYDFALYGAAAALFINRLYFPTADAVTGSLAAFATFAVGFFARPLGGFVVAHYGDRIGRKPALIFTVALMGASTVLIGLLPGYDTLGLWAPVLLVLLRLLQGFGAGAELAGAITYIAEYTPTRRRAFYTSIPNACTAVGLALAVGLYAALGALLDEAQMLSWGWRVPFVASALIVFVAIYIRRRLHESPAFAAEQRKIGTATKLPLGEVLHERGRNVVLGFLAVTGHNANAYVLNAFSLGYITGTLHLGRGLALAALLFAAAAGTVMTPLFGTLADRIGRKPVFVGGAVFVALFAFPFFGLLGTGSPALVILAMVLGYGLGFGAMSGAQGAYLAELFATRYRYTGIAAAREMNSVLIAGPTPFIASALVAAAGGQPWLVAWYLIGCQAVTVVSVLLTRADDASIAAVDVAQPRAATPAGT
jgi:MFS transporter, MHS family, shikimate and dehydroshikimate transport protein